MVSFIENMQNGKDESVRSLSNKQELLAKVVELFPYPIQIFTLDGTAKMINKAAVEMIGIKNIESHVGKYNVFEDPVVQKLGVADQPTCRIINRRWDPVVQKLGVADQVRQVLKGKTVFITDFNAPYQELMRHYNLLDRDIQTISADITCFPLMTDGVTEYFAAVFFFKKIYRGKEEVELGRRYIEAHWKEPYNADKTAKAACLSKSHFTKLFKKHTGVTPPGNCTVKNYKMMISLCYRGKRRAYRRLTLCPPESDCGFR